MRQVFAALRMKYCPPKLQVYLRLNPIAKESDCEDSPRKNEARPGNQLPLLLRAYYEGIRSEQYYGTGKDETEGWMFTFNGPGGFFSGKARAEREMVSRVCKTA